MKVAIVGTVGLPAKYGGWETLVENLVKFHHEQNRGENLTVYCTKTAYTEQPSKILGTHLRYSRFKANGAQSVIYDAVTMLDAVRRGVDVIVLLGISGAIALPLIRLISRAKIITNIDGIEWRRDKWQGFARRFLRYSEHLAVRCSHVVVADNEGISNYVTQTYGHTPETIAYGGDHAVAVEASSEEFEHDLPEKYALSVCRIEPENNIGMILAAFAKSDTDLVLVGNWKSSAYGRTLKAQYTQHSNLHLLDPIYHLPTLRWLRENAFAYVHGHSAGGTNPSLVEIMHVGVPVLAFDCTFNRFTTEEHAFFFKDEVGILDALADLTPDVTEAMTHEMLDTARRRYTWNKIGVQYFNLISGSTDPLL